MDVTNNIIAVVPARAGSVRLPGKNRMLIEYTFEQIRQCSFLQKQNVIVSSDDLFILNKAKDYSFLRKKRNAVLSSSGATQYDTVIDAIDFYNGMGEHNIDAIILLQPTSPLRTSRCIDAAIQQFIFLYKKEKIESLVSVSRVHEEPVCIVDAQGKAVTKTHKDYFFINGAIYICTLNFLKKNKCFHKAKESSYFLMPKWQSIDVDDAEDFELAELIISGAKNNGKK